jgi:hypothetical protein
MKLHAVGIQPTMALVPAERQERLVHEMTKRNLRFERNQPFSWPSLAEEIVHKQGRHSKKNRLKQSAQGK